MVPIRLILFFYLFGVFQACAQESPFSLLLQGNQSEGSTLFIAIYEKSARNWRAIPFKQMQWTLPTDENVTIPLPLAAGTYAIRAFVDTNNNGVLETSKKGRPLEPFGSSIGHSRSRPSLQFKLSTFRLSKKRPQATVLLRYPKTTKSAASAPTLEAPQPLDEPH